MVATLSEIMGPFPKIHHIPTEISNMVQADVDHNGQNSINYSRLKMNLLMLSVVLFKSNLK